VGIVLCALNSFGQTNVNVDTGPSLQSFKIISQRNIFDPNRSRGFRRDDTRPRTRPRAVDAFALVGTMSYTKGTFAFFDGSSSQYKQVLEPGAKIAGYTVKQIAPKAVTLAANGKEFEMKVGTQLRNEGSNGWRLSSQPSEPVSAEPDGEASADAQPTAPPTGATPQMNDVLKRLMEQRQQELK